jgi:hypothetical protein
MLRMSERNETERESSDNPGAGQTTGGKDSRRYFWNASGIQWI